MRESLSYNGVVFSSSSMIFLFSCYPNASFKMLYHPSFFFHANFSKVWVLQELSENVWFEMFPSAKNQGTCVDGVALCKRVPSKLWQFLFQELNSQKRKARELHLPILGSPFLFSHHVTRSEEEKQNRNFQAEEELANLFQKQTTATKTLGFEKSQILQS